MHAYLDDAQAQVGDVGEGDDNSVPMMLNPLRTHGASNDSTTEPTIHEVSWFSVFHLGTLAFS